MAVYPPTLIFVIAGLSYTACSTSDLQPNYTHYPGGGILGSDEYSIVGTAGECQEKCSSDPKCRNFEREMSSRRCQFHYVSPSRDNWSPADNWETYQKTCAKWASWKQKTCTCKADCYSGVNAECWKNLCVCSLGFYHSISQDKCVKSCPTSNLQSSYMHYPSGGISGYNEYTMVGTAQECQGRCSSDPKCRNFERHVASGTCKIHYVDPNAKNYGIGGGWETYQKNCA